MTYRVSTDALLPPMTPQLEVVCWRARCGAQGYDDHLAGHITHKQPDGTFYTNPWFLLWDEFTPDDVVRIDLDGNVVEVAGPRRRGSSCISSCTSYATTSTSPSTTIPASRRSGRSPPHPAVPRPDVGARWRQGRDRQRVRRHRRRRRQGTDRRQGDRRRRHCTCSPGTVCSSPDATSPKRICAASRSSNAVARRIKSNNSAAASARTRRGRHVGESHSTGSGRRWLTRASPRSFTDGVHLGLTAHRGAHTLGRRTAY